MWGWVRLYCRSVIGSWTTYQCCIYFISTNNLHLYKVLKKEIFLIYYYLINDYNKFFNSNISATINMGGVRYYQHNHNSVDKISAMTAGINAIVHSQIDLWTPRSHVQPRFFHGVVELNPLEQLVGLVHCYRRNICVCVQWWMCIVWRPLVRAVKLPTDSSFLAAPLS